MGIIAEGVAAAGIAGWPVPQRPAGADMGVERRAVGQRRDRLSRASRKRARVCRENHLRHRSVLALLRGSRSARRAAELPPFDVRIGRAAPRLRAAAAAIFSGTIVVFMFRAASSVRRDCAGSCGIANGPSIQCREPRRQSTSERFLRACIGIESVALARIRRPARSRRVAHSRRRRPASLRNAGRRPRRPAAEPVAVALANRQHQRGRAVG